MFVLNAWVTCTRKINHVVVGLCTDYAAPRPLSDVARMVYSPHDFTADMLDCGSNCFVPILRTFMGVRNTVALLCSLGQG